MHLSGRGAAMKAAVLHEYGGPEKLKWEELPDPVAGEGEVLVRLSATSVNPVDYKMRSGAAKERFPLEFPAVLGRDVAGVVREVGAKVTGFAAGDRVMALGSKAYAELVVVKAAELAHVPEDLEISEAAALPLVTLTGRASDLAWDGDQGWADGAGGGSAGRRGAVGGLDGEEGGCDGACGGAEVAVEAGRRAGGG